jgi:pyridoxamine 5'-phosphate oxidase
MRKQGAVDKNYPIRPVISGDNPFDLFANWFAEAEKSEPNDPNAMTLATVDTEGHPHLRVVLLKGFDEKGFCFFTNTGSRKGRELQARAVAALCFHWKSLRRQVRIEGVAEAVTSAEADAYFASRPRGSQIGAWASLQSQPLEARGILEARVTEYEKKFEGQPVPRPENWSGYRVVPQAIEFWQDMPYRLHDRLVFTRAQNGWMQERLYP